MKIETINFGVTSEGKKIKKYVMKNKFLEVGIIEYGGIITEILQKDKAGKVENIVLGYEKIKDYEKCSLYLGCIVGRVGGRISKGEFSIDGKIYKLDKNNGENCLHGGEMGLNKRIWGSKIHNDGVELIYESPHLEGGFPGKVIFKVTYTLEDKNIIITYEASSDRKTYVNLTNHSYFNLSGGKRKITSHELYVDADYFMKLREGNIPTGEFKKVDGTIFDCRKRRTLSYIKKSKSTDIVDVGQGFDHPFILNKSNKWEISIKEKESGRQLDMETSEPVVIVYTGNSLKDEGVLSNGVKAEKYLGICLETQKYPDIFNLKDVPLKFIEPGIPYRASTRYKIYNV